MKKCAKCKLAKELSEYYRCGDDYQGYCKPCQTVYGQENKEQRNLYVNKYRKANPEATKACQVKWASKQEDPYIHQKLWKKNNPGKVLANKARRRAAKLNATVSWSDKEAIERLYITASWCTNYLGEGKWHVDHIVPLQGKNVCGLHVEYNLQVIKASENLAKSNKF